VTDGSASWSQSVFTNAGPPTTKPLEFAERAIGNSSQPVAPVLKLFLGSGTTLIPSERLARVCRAVELDPHYVDVAVIPWEAFTRE